MKYLSECDGHAQGKPRLIAELVSFRLKPGVSLSEVMLFEFTLMFTADINGRYSTTHILDDKHISLVSEVEVQGSPSIFVGRFSGYIHTYTGIFENKDFPMHLHLSSARKRRFRSLKAEIFKNSC